MYAHICIHTCVYTCSCVCVYVYTWVCPRVCVYYIIYTQMTAHSVTWMYAHTHTHTHTHTQTHTNVHIKCMCAYIREESLTVQKGKLSTSAWMDRKTVMVMSTNCQPHGAGSVLRRLQDGSRITVLYPESIISYNKYMGGVD